jgi:acyl dehydratase
VRFADLTPGVVIRTQPRVVTAKEMVEFASRYDPQWLHVDTVRARDGRYSAKFGCHLAANSFAWMMQYHEITCVG